MPNERYTVQFSIEADVEILLPAEANDWPCSKLEKEINRRAYEQIDKEMRKARGTPFDVILGHWEGPY